MGRVRVKTGIYFCLEWSKNVMPEVYHNYIVEMSTKVPWNEDDVKRVLSAKYKYELFHLKGTKLTRFIITVHEGSDIEAILRSLHYLYPVGMKYNAIKDF